MKRKKTENDKQPVQYCRTSGNDNHKKVKGCEENVYPAVMCVTISVCVKHHSRATVQRQRNKGNGLDEGEL